MDRSGGRETMHAREYIRLGLFSMFFSGALIAAPNQSRRVMVLQPGSARRSRMRRQSNTRRS